MPEYISVTDAARRFTVSDRTLRNWIKWGWLDANRVIIDGRAHQLINVEELKALMKERGIQEHTGTPEYSGMTFDIEELKQEIDDLRGRIFQLEIDTHLITLIENLEKRIEALENAASASKGVQRIERAVSTQGNALASNLGHKTTGGGSLPFGFVGLQEFRHGIPETNALRWAKGRGLAGDWRSARGHVVKLALSPQVQREYYLHFSTHERFEACELCPHEIQEQ